MKSKFWKYRIFTSKRKRNEFRAGKQVESKFSKTSWCGPFAFCQEIDEKEFRTWVREHLGVKTEHIECEISVSESKNRSALKTLAFHLTMEIHHLGNRARPGNFIIKWLAPTKEDFVFPPLPNPNAGRGIAAI